jgi:cell division transport system ATP-binding protein
MMLEVVDVSKTYGDIVALKSVSFEADQNEIVFITGRSGSGKTTLLKLILRDIIPDTGKIMFEGKDIFSLSSSEIPFYRQKIGVVFQDFKVLTEKTVRENIEIALAVVGVPQSEWEARVDDVLKMVGLEDRSELFPLQLSGGELQRVSLARSLVVNPKMILADEPTGNLDWDTSEGIMEVFKKVAESGKLIIMATHNLNLVKKYANLDKESKIKTKIVELS